MNRKTLGTRRLTIENVPILNFEFDREAHAVYITVASGEVDRTKRISDSLMVDVDKKGKILGIEILRVKQVNIAPIIKQLAQDYPLRDLLHLQTA